MRARLLATAAIAVAVTGCFKAKTSDTESPTSPSATVSTEAVFPHKSDWNDPAQHGLYVKDALGMNISSCLGCHAEMDTTGGGAPSCKSCHKNFPHTEPGVTKETHGAFVIANSKGVCATQCHGTDWGGGLSGVACTQCHANYPHANAWSTPAVHGPAAKGDLKNTCAPCHGMDWKGGNAKVSCYTCHKDAYPHAQGWASPDQHGKFVLASGTGKCATQCHGVQLDGGLSGISCKSCHTIWPHPAVNWMKQHGETAQLIGITGCTSCHKDDATGGKTGVNCSQCHSTLPAHAEADWKTVGHGKLVMQQPAFLTDPKGCPLCHGGKLEGGKVPTQPALKPVPACATCHSSYPFLHKTVAGSPAWNSFEGHGKWVMNQVDVGKTGVTSQIETILEECKLCHGNDLTGGTVGKGCYTCHAIFPHQPAAPGYAPWASPARHGMYANAETPKAKSCATANCHGVDLTGLPTGEKDMVKKLVRGCADCHLQMPHKPFGQWYHGQSKFIPNTVQLNVVECAKCHGTTWTGGTNAPSCTSAGCHNYYPMPHRSATGAVNLNWDKATGHGKVVMDVHKGGPVKSTVLVLCKTCHGNDLTGGTAEKSCYQCHKSFPHAAAPVAVAGTTYTFEDAAWGGFDKGHGQYIVARSKQSGHAISKIIQLECAKSCHGSDLLSGTSKKSCYDCHKNYPHPADWVKPYDPADKAMPGGTHGLEAVKTGTGGCLAGCHAIDPPGGNSGKNCSTCHNYPHKSDWKLGTNAPEYPPHAAAVIATQNTATKGDDKLNDAAFADCAKCHGEALVFKYDHYPLNVDEQTITLAPGATVPRCTKCHVFPHQTLLDIDSKSFSYKPFPWEQEHWVAVAEWNKPVNNAFSQQTCGSIAGNAACHATGPWPQPPKQGEKNTTGYMIDFDSTGYISCNYCHMKP